MNLLIKVAFVTFEYHFRDNLLVVIDNLIFTFSVAIVILI